MSTFDERFADRVRDTFDAYEEPVDEGAWRAMEHKLKAERPSRLMLWAPKLARIAAAAVLLVAVYGMWPDAAPDVSRQEVSVLTPFSEMAEEPIPHAEPIAEMRLAQRTRPAPPAAAVPREIEEERAPEPDTHPEVWHNIEVSPDPTPPSVVLQAQAPQADEPESVAVPVAPRANSEFHVWAGTMATVADQRLAEGASLTLGVGHTWALAESVHLSTGGAVTYQNIAYAPNVPSAEVFTTTVSQSGQTLTARLEERREITTWAVEVPVVLGFDLARTPDLIFRVQGGMVSVAYVSQRFLEEGTRITGEPKVNVASGQTEVVLTQAAFRDQERVAPFSRAEIGGFLHLGMGAEVKPSGLGLDVFYRRSLRGTTQREVQLSGIGVGLRVSL